MIETDKYGTPHVDARLRDVDVTAVLTKNKAMVYVHPSGTGTSFYLKLNGKQCRELSDMLGDVAEEMGT